MSYDERIYNAAITDGMPNILSVLIVAQARHETNNYQSNVFLTCRNCFGYKWVGQSTAVGPCTGSPEGDQYAKYNTIEESVHELTGWIKRRQRDGYFPANLNEITTPDRYAQLLKYADPNHMYYGASVATYTTQLVYWLQRIGNTLVAPETSSVLLILIAIALIIWRKRIF